MTNQPPPSPDGHLDLAVGLLLDQIATMNIIGLLNRSTAENVVHAYLFDMRLSARTRSQAAALHNDIRRARAKEAQARKKGGN